MIYKLLRQPDKSFELEPVPYQNMHLEKELEDLLATHLLDVLFEGNQLLPSGFAEGVRVTFALHERRFPCSVSIFLGHDKL